MFAIVHFGARTHIQYMHRRKKLQLILQNSHWLVKFDNTTFQFNWPTKIATGLVLLLCKSINCQKIYIYIYMLLILRWTESALRMYFGFRRKAAPELAQSYRCDCAVSRVVPILPGKHAQVMRLGLTWLSTYWGHLVSTALILRTGHSSSHSPQVEAQLLRSNRKV